MQKIRNKQERRQMMFFMICLLFLLATMFGAILGNRLDIETLGQVQSDMAQLFQQELGSNAFGGIFIKYLKYDVLIWLGGCFAYGGILSAGVLTFRGISLGYTTAIWLRTYGSKGMLAAVCSLLPQNLLLLPVYLAMTWFALCFLAEQKKGVSGKGALRREIKRKWTEYGILLWCSVVLVGVAAFLELYAASGLLSIIAPLY